MKRILPVVFLFFTGCAGFGGINLEDTKAPPPVVYQAGTATDLSGSTTGTKVWSASVLNGAFSGASAEVVDAAVAAAGNGDTTHTYSKDDIHDYVIQFDTDLDGDVDVVQGIVLQADCSGITSGMCLDTDNGKLYSWDGDSVELVGVTDYQPLDPDLTTWAGITPDSNVGTFLATPSVANLLSALSDEGAWASTVLGWANAAGARTSLGLDSLANANTAWSSSLFSNPMTTAGDIIYGGASGAPTRLAGSGSDAYVLAYNTSTNAPYWKADATGAGGSAITLDIGDDAGNDSTDLTEIATSGDTNSIFTESAADKLLIDLTKDWPKADSADAFVVADAGDTAATYYVIIVDGATGTQVANTDAGITYNPSTNAFTITGSITAPSFLSSAADGAHYLDAINTVAISSTATAGRIAYYNGYHYAADGSDWDDYFLTNEMKDTWAEQPALTSAYILVGNGSNQPAAVAMSGDVAINNAGATTIQPNAVGYAETDGSSKALAPVVDAAADFSTTFTGNNLFGGTFICDTTGTSSLAAGAANQWFGYQNRGAVTPTIDPNGTEVIYLNGTSCGAGVTIVGSGAATDMAAFQWDGTNWEVRASGFTCGS